MNNQNNLVNTEQSASGRWNGRLLQQGVEQGVECGVEQGGEGRCSSSFNSSPF